MSYVHRACGNSCYIRAKGSAIPCSITVLGTSGPGEPDCDEILMLGITYGKQSLTAVAGFWERKCAWKHMNIKNGARKGQAVKIDNRRQLKKTGWDSFICPLLPTVVAFFSAQPFILCWSSLENSNWNIQRAQTYLTLKSLVRVLSWLWYRHRTWYPRPWNPSILSYS